MKFSAVRRFFQPRRLAAALAAAALLLSALAARAQTEKILYQFSGPISGVPVPLLMDGAGDLFGVVFDSRIEREVVFELVLTNGVFTEQGVASFPQNAGVSALTMDNFGDIFGTTGGGGGSCPGGCGTVFELADHNGAYTLITLYSFDPSQRVDNNTVPDGAIPMGGVQVETIWLDSNNQPAGFTLVGTTSSGGAYGLGTAFQLDTGIAGDQTTTPPSPIESVLYSFGSGSGLANPISLSGTFGNYFGTTAAGAYLGHEPGGIFSLSNFTFNPPPLGQAGNGYTSATETDLHEFALNSGAGDIAYESPGDPTLGFSSQYPMGFALFGAGGGGGQYGHGAVYRFVPGASGAAQYQVLYSFGATDGDGADPAPTLAMDSQGNLYGTTEGGGIHSVGTVFELVANASGSYTEKILHSFPETPQDGVEPASGVVVDQFGNLFGITSQANNAIATLDGPPVVFEIEPADADASASLSPASLTFSSQAPNTTSAPQTVTLTNTGAVPLTISAIGIPGLGADSFGVSNNCGGSLAPGANCAIQVSFSPQQAGSISATLQVADNAPDSPQSVALSGGGASSAPAVALSPASLSFAPQLTASTSAAKTVTVSNSGTAALAISAVAASGDFAATNSCPASLAPKASCAVAVSFAPTVTGARAGQLTITDNAPDSPQTVTLAGTGLDLTLAPTNAGGAASTVTPGQTASFAMSLTATSNFSGTIALSCAGAPAEASCSIQPVSVSLVNGDSAAFSVSVTTTAASRLAPPPPPAPAPEEGGRYRSEGWALAALALALLAGAVFAADLRRRDRRQGRLGAALLPPLALLALLAAGCGGGSSPTNIPNPQPAANAGTPPGAYTLTITATAAAGGVRSAKLQLTVGP